MRDEMERKEIEERKAKIAATFQVHAERNPPVHAGSDPQGGHAQRE